MINQVELDNLLRTLHSKDSPLIIFNIWDAGSAQEASKAGLKAIATSSWSVAAAHGYADGEGLPLDLVIGNIQRIVRVINLPVTVDVEAGYGQNPTQVQQTIVKIVKAGAAGINIEDQIIGKNTIYSCDDQCERIKAARESTSIPIFINARTDIFLKILSENHNDDHLEEALFRASAYAKSGADGFFTPGLKDNKLIEKLCKFSPVPVNIMITPNGPTAGELAELGVSRISYGPMPYCSAMESFRNALRQSTI